LLLAAAINIVRSLDLHVAIGIYPLDLASALWFFSIATWLVKSALHCYFERSEKK
jgi:hypothetical protein